MIQLHHDLTKPMLGFGGTASAGRPRRAHVLSRRRLVRQSAGLVVRDERVADDRRHAGSDARRTRRSAGSGSSSPRRRTRPTIYKDDLPVWAQNKGRRTEYDLFLAELAARGIKDGRPEAAARRRARPAARPIYLLRLALDRGGRDRGVQRRRRGRRPSGLDGSIRRPRSGRRRCAPRCDIARVAGVEQGVSEPTRELALPSAERAKRSCRRGPCPTTCRSPASPARRFSVIGDSFTTDLFTTMLVQHVGRAIWINHQRCGFDWKWIDVYRPDEVWWMPTERFLDCKPAPWPVGLAAVTAGDDRAPRAAISRSSPRSCRRAARRRPRRARQSGERAERGAQARAGARPARRAAPNGSRCPPRSTPVSRTISASGRR